MSKNLILAQDISEFNSVRSKIKVDFVCLPINLELMVYLEVSLFLVEKKSILWSLSQMI